MDHIKKLVYIIVGCLTIVSLVFTLCHKIGHCEELDNSGYLYVPSITYYNPNFVQYYENIVDTIGSDFDTSGDYANLIYINSIEDATLNSQGYTHVLMLTKYSTTTTYSYFGGPSASSWNGGYKINPNSGGSQPLYENYNTLGPSYIYYFRNGSYPSAGITHLKYYLFKSSDGTVDSTNQSFSNKFANRLCLYKDNDDNFDSYYMPIYCDVGIANSDNKIYGVSSVPSGGGGDGPEPHSKGGVLRNYIDSTDLIEQDSSLPSVDTSPPSDTTSNSAWYQKILNGMGKINDSIKGGVLTVGDYLGQIKEDLENAIAWITEPPDSDTIMDNVEPYLAQNDLIGGFLASKSAIQGVYSSIGNVSAKTRSQMIWDIPFNLPSMSQTFHAQIDFGWYENIRSTLEPFLNMFLMIGFLFSFIRSIPGILHGNSGEGDT